MKTVSGPVKYGKTSLMQIVLNHFGLEHITGKYMNWEPDGFHAWVKGYDLPVHVITREFTFEDYPGDSEPDKDDRIVHIVGTFDTENYVVRAFKWWFEGDEMPV
ncbi:hypothetical protein ACKUB1_17845 [Methanospirillum stamsii]|uniref:Uncharacterized protein n=1 Tax=Methanospirillum stamsii TaxID=1277351 RepID=A0A2V2N6K4_9EURY|nr:hypothetical protein [Methanospirillum stamsii]PWR73356.1 hypothetical protein DLD82_10850 [Methanospirillum stamsii]